jgi:hypothetical protein
MLEVFMNKFKKFWEYAFERSIKTVAQAAVAILTLESVTGIADADWAMIGGVAGLAGLVSILTSLTTFNFSSENVGGEPDFA